MKKIILSGTILLALITSCKREEKSKIERVFDVNVNMENDFLNIESTRKQFNSHSGEFYSGIDTVLMYGAGYSKKIDDSLKGYNVEIYLSAWVRENQEPCEGGIAVALNSPGGNKDWRVLQPKPGAFKAGEWNQIIDTIRYNAGLINESNEIKIFSIKQKGADNLDVDDLRIRYKFYK